MKASANGIVVVTGIGGFLGRHIAARLLEGGYTVRGTVRALKRVGDIESAVRYAKGAREGLLSFHAADLLSDEGWADVMAGAAYVIHAASPFPSRVPDDENELIVPAREGTLRVMKAAKAAGVRRVVLTSSIAAINYGSGRAPFTEEDWTDVNGPLATPYYKSKTIAEKAAWAFSRENGVELSVINPGMILGPVLGRDSGTSIGVILNLLKGKFPAAPKFNISIVDVRDVAAAHLLAMTVPAAAGERFIVSAQTVSIMDIASILRRNFPAYAGKMPRFTLPNWLARIAARFDASLKLIQPELGRDARISNAKAQRVLGWRPRSKEEAVCATAQSLIDAGLV